MADGDQQVEVDGHRIRLRNLEKVLYPATGTTKAEVLTYYMRVAPRILPHLADRPVTRIRWPDGVARQPFFEKNVPSHTPEWVRTVVIDSPGSTRQRDTLTYPVFGGTAELIWSAQLAALELHVPQWTVGPRGAVRHPDRLVIDLDPGEPAGLAECAEVALIVRERLAADGLRTVPVTSGSKGMQLYASISGKQNADTVNAYAKEVAEELAVEHPKLVVSNMTKAIRGGKVLFDWSQNNPGKTTICPYSLRGRDLPRVAAPRTWAELEAGGLEQLDTDTVLDRVTDDGDLAADLFTPGPKLPG